MNFDRNTIIGFVVLALLFFGYFYYNNQEQKRYNDKEKREKALPRRIHNGLWPLPVHSGML